MKTLNDYTPEEVELIVEYCQPKYCSWAVEWLEENNQGEINKYNVWDYLADNIEDVDAYIAEFLVG
jgi:hypothetical protein